MHTRYFAKFWINVLSLVKHQNSKEFLNLPNKKKYLKLQTRYFALFRIFLLEKLQNSAHDKSIVECKIFSQDVFYFIIGHIYLLHRFSNCKTFL